MYYYMFGSVHYMDSSCKQDGCPVKQSMPNSAVPCFWHNKEQGWSWKKTHKKELQVMVSRPISIYMSIALWCIFVYYTSFDVYFTLSRENVSQNTPEGWALFQCDLWLPRNSQHPWFFLRPLNVMSTTNHIVTALNSRKSNLIIICMVSYPYKTRRCIIPFTNLIECAFSRRHAIWQFHGTLVTHHGDIYEVPINKILTLRTYTYGYGMVPSPIISSVINNNILYYGTIHIRNSKYDVVR